MDDEVLTSENSPELKVLIEKLSAEALEENREAYEELAKYDSTVAQRYSYVSRTT